MKRTCLAAGLLLLALIWGGPLPGLAMHAGPQASGAYAFSAHMTMHMGVVALAAPLIAIDLSGSGLDPTRRWPRLFPPLGIAMAEFAVVWGWHMPGLHGLARHAPGLLVLEQASFLAVGLLLWLSCLGNGAGNRMAGSLMGTLALLVTSMHMTLLGALLAFASRPLYHHEHAAQAAALADQQLGGVIMLMVGGAVYLAGGLVLMARVLLAPEERRVMRGDAP
ncbi:cytochrome c oxidase assembly protein [Ancylobacter oerskovii]|uniref:Cytochrome c oxidase assembly protein n=1 Tax=Ancylobacter oerskovii TaxID=459519 RepID=A0ABW4Z2E1_9HYPH|nr:cytochrome c oxidase assembly protein [Ancylobacter oerskovii]MBS7544737.1 cytochrome c oxidase assembly protein [Ancylobacter oerskovii]